MDEKRFGRAYGAATVLEIGECRWHIRCPIARVEEREFDDAADRAAWCTPSSSASRSAASSNQQSSVQAGSRYAEPARIGSFVGMSIGECGLISRRAHEREIHEKRREPRKKSRLPHAGGIAAGVAIVHNAQRIVVVARDHQVGCSLPVEACQRIAPGDTPSVSAALRFILLVCPAEARHKIGVVDLPPSSASPHSSAARSHGRSGEQVAQRAEGCLPRFGDRSFGEESC